MSRFCYFPSHRFAGWAMLLGFVMLNGSGCQQVVEENQPMAAAENPSTNDLSAAQDATPARQDQPLSEAEWKERLTPEQYYICRAKGTERPFANAYWDNHRSGIYHCVACGEALFDSETKYESGSGWPSFWAPIKSVVLAEHTDRSIPGMPRIEITCKKCGSHLGHVFDDGPRDKTGLRYCMNSAALKFHEREATPEKTETPKETK